MLSCKLRQAYIAAVSVFLIVMPSLATCGGLYILVDLTVEASSKGPVSKLLISNVANGSENRAILAAPTNRNALAFFVFDVNGHPVAPTPVAKSDPLSRQLDLGQGESYEYVQEPLNDPHANVVFRFITHTGVFGYALEPHSEYRVTAVYRPWGDRAYGRTSDEIVIRLDRLTDSESSIYSLELTLSAESSDRCAGHSDIEFPLRFRITNTGPEKISSEDVIRIIRDSQLILVGPDNALHALDNPMGIWRTVPPPELGPQDSYIHPNCSGIDQLVKSRAMPNGDYRLDWVYQSHRTGLLVTHTKEIFKPARVPGAGPVNGP